jgi:hypothetical protein
MRDRIVSLRSLDAALSLVEGERRPLVTPSTSKTVVEGADRYPGLSSCRFFHASIPGLWWKRGNTHRNKLSPGFRHQQSG